MREWQVGDPTGTGEDLGVPDIAYMGYLKERDDDNRGNGNGSSGHVKLSFEASMKMARTYKSKGDYAEAIRYYNDALEYSYYHEEAMCEKAECLEKLGQKIDASDIYYELAFSLGGRDNEKASKYYKRCYDLNPNHKKLLWDFPILLKDMKRYSQAIFYFEKNISQNAFCSDACPWHIAHCYSCLKDYKSELEWIDKCLDNRFCLQDVEIKFTCLKNLNRLDEGIKFCEESVDCFLNNTEYPGDGDAIKLLEYLIKIKNKPEYVEKINLILDGHKMSYYVIDALAQTCLECRNEELIKFMSTYSDDDYEVFIEKYSKITGQSPDEFKTWYLKLKRDDLFFINDYFSYPADEKYEKVLSVLRWWTGLYRYLELCQ